MNVKRATYGRPARASRLAETAPTALKNGTPSAECPEQTDPQQLSDELLLELSLEQDDEVSPTDEIAVTVSTVPSSRAEAEFSDIPPLDTSSEC